jgi:hypothetical protein
MISDWMNAFAEMLRWWKAAEADEKWYVCLQNCDGREDGTEAKKK